MTGNGTAALLGVDWGSTRVRASVLSAGGARLRGILLDEGVRTVRGPACGDVFERLRRSCALKGTELPTLLSGMVGSAQGWLEVPYVASPASLADIAAGLVAAPAAGAWIVPGVSGRALSGAPDVMRGEETQLMGLEGDGLVVLPGTHSKWVLFEEGAIQQFSTCMTGEAFELLRTYGLIGAVMHGDTHEPDAFARGLGDASGPGGLLHQLFTVRSRTLLGDLEAGSAYSYASGLLIGSEVAAMTADVASASTVRVVGTEAISRRYCKALEVHGLKPLWVHGEAAASRGLFRIASAAGLTRGAT